MSPNVNETAELRESGAAVYAASVLESTTDAVVVLDTNWRFLYLNGHATALVQHQEVLGKIVWEALPRPAGGVFENTCRKVMAERLPMRCEDYYTPLDTWFENRIFPCEAGIVVYFRDISEKMRCEQARQETAEIARQQFSELGDIYERAPIGLAYLSPDFRYLRVNQRLASMSGYPVAAHLGRTVRELMPDLADTVEALLRRVVETGSPVFDSEVHGETPAWPGVRRVWITQYFPQKDTTGKVVAINVVVEDVTTRKRIERRLQRQIDELQAVFDAVPAAVFITQDPNSRSIVGNRVTEQLLRLPHGAELSKSAGEYAPSNFKVFKNGVELDAAELPLQKVAATGLPVRNFELTFTFDTGDQIHAYGNAVPLFDESGMPRGAVGAFVDVTGLVEAREAVLRSRAELERLIDQRTRALVETNTRLSAQIVEHQKIERKLLQLQKQEMLGLLASGLAHDFNNLLQVIGGSLDALEVQPPTAPIDRLFAIIRRACARGAGLTDRLFSLARDQQTAPTRVDVNLLIVSASDLLARTLGAEIKIARTLTAELWPVLIDSSQLELALLNLAINARDAMPDGGPLTFATMNVAAGDARLPAHLARLDCVRITVTDQGLGMSEEVRMRALEPFFTTKQDTGTGLGLNLVDETIREAGGRVRLRSQPGAGTAVELFLPRALPA